MVGEHAAEVIQGMAIAIKMGATKKDLIPLGIQPTVAAEEFVTYVEPITLLAPKTKILGLTCCTNRLLCSSTTRFCSPLSGQG